MHDTNEAHDWQWQRCDAPLTAEELAAGDAENLCAEIGAREAREWNEANAWSQRQ